MPEKPRDSVPDPLDFPSYPDSFFIDPRRIVQEAGANISLLGLEELLIFKEALQGAIPEEPVLVQRLDRPAMFYYLIPFRKMDEISAVARMDALTGEFLELSLCHLEQVALSRDSITDLLCDQQIDLGDEKGVVVLQKGSFSFHDCLVWMPCEESRSFYYPFHRVNFGSTPIYISHEGTIHTHLTKSVR